MTQKRSGLGKIATGVLAGFGFWVLCGVAWASTTITLEQPVYFVTPGGENLVVEPGTYEVEAAEAWLRLMAGERRDALLVAAEKSTHEDQLDEPVALSVPGEVEDQHHVVLLQPDGTSLEAIGSYSGVRERGIKRRLLSIMRRQAYLAKKRAAAARARRQQAKVPPPSSQSKTCKPVPDDFDHNGSLTNVRAAFDRLNGKRKTLRFFKRPSIDMTPGRAHFQGVQRLRVKGPDGKLGRLGNYLVISSSHDAKLFFVHMGSRTSSPSRYWRSNSATLKVGGANFGHQKADRVISQINTGYRSVKLPDGRSLKSHWTHAGGIQVSGRYLFVGVERDLNRNTPSFIKVYDIDDVLANPTNARALYVISRSGGNGVGKGTAGAVGVTKLRDGRFLMAVAEWNSDVVDFYIKEPRKGDCEAQIRTNNPPWRPFYQWKKKQLNHLKSVDGKWGKYQSFNLVTQRDGKIYALAGNKSWPKDFMDLHEISLCEQAVRNNVRHPCFAKGAPMTGPQIAITKVDNLHVTCDDWCHFQGAAGAYVAGNRLALYSTVWDADKGDRDSTVRMAEISE